MHFWDVVETGDEGGWLILDCFKLLGWDLGVSGWLVLLIFEIN